MPRGVRSLKDDQASAVPVHPPRHHQLRRLPRAPDRARVRRSEPPPLQSGRLGLCRPALACHRPRRAAPFGELVLGPALA